MLLAACAVTAVVLAATGSLQGETPVLLSGISLCFLAVLRLRSIDGGYMSRQPRPRLLAAAHQCGSHFDQPDSIISELANLWRAPELTADEVAAGGPRAPPGPACLPGRYWRASHQPGEPNLRCLGDAAKPIQPRLCCQGYAAKGALPRLPSRGEGAKVLTLPRSLVSSQGHVAQLTQPRLRCHVAQLKLRCRSCASKVTLPRLHSQG